MDPECIVLFCPLNSCLSSWTRGKEMLAMWGRIVIAPRRQGSAALRIKWWSRMKCEDLTQAGLNPWSSAFIERFFLMGRTCGSGVVQINMLEILQPPKEWAREWKWKQEMGKFISASCFIFYFCSGRKSYRLNLYSVHLSSHFLSYSHCSVLVAQSCLTLCDPMDKITFVMCCVCARLLSHVWLCTIPWTVACWAPLSMGFPRQELWSGLTFPFSRGSFCPREQTLMSHIVGRFFTVWTTRGDLTARSTHFIFHLNFVSFLLIWSYTERFGSPKSHVSVQCLK